MEWGYLVIMCAHSLTQNPPTLGREPQIILGNFASSFRCHILHEHLILEFDLRCETLWSPGVSQWAGGTEDASSLYKLVSPM